MDNYNYSTPSSYESGTYFLVVILISIISYVVVSFFLSTLFKKTGAEGWKAWVPIYNSWTFLEIAGIPGWYSLFALAGVIPFIGFIGSIIAAVYSIIAAYKIGRGFQKSGGWVVMYIFLPLIWIIVFAYTSTPFNRNLALQPSLNGYGNPYPPSSNQTPPTHYSGGPTQGYPYGSTTGYEAPTAPTNPTTPPAPANPAESPTEPQKD